jgi:hypothetical protein
MADFYVANHFAHCRFCQEYKIHLDAAGQRKVNKKAAPGGSACTNRGKWRISMALHLRHCRPKAKAIEVKPVRGGLAVDQPFCGIIGPEAMQKYQEYVIECENFEAEEGGDMILGDEDDIKAILEGNADGALQDVVGKRMMDDLYWVRNELRDGDDRRLLFGRKMGPPSENYLDFQEMLIQRLGSMESQFKSGWIRSNRDSDGNIITVQNKWEDCIDLYILCRLIGASEAESDAVLQTLNNILVKRESPISVPKTFKYIKQMITRDIPQDCPVRTFKISVLDVILGRDWHVKFPQFRKLKGWAVGYGVDPLKVISERLFFLEPEELHLRPRKESDRDGFAVFSDYASSRTFRRFFKQVQKWTRCNPPGHRSQ